MICTQCGALHHEDDKHICIEAEKVTKGKEKKKGSSVFTAVAK